MYVVIQNVLLWNLIQRQVMKQKSSIQLIKNNILPLQTLENNLCTNFKKIEQEFKKMKYQLSGLKENSIMIIDRLNQLDPNEQLNYFQGLDMDVDEGQGSAEKSSHAGIGLVNDEPLSKIKLDGQQVDNSELEAQDHLEELCRENQRDINRKRKDQASRDSQVSLARNSSKLKKQNKQNSKADPMIKQFIRDLEKRLDELQQDKKTQDNQISILARDNEAFKRMLGFKDTKNKNNKKNKQEDGKEHKMEKRSSKVDEKTEKKVELKQQQENSQKFDQQLDQNNFVSAFNKELSQLKQYIKAKVTLLDNNFQKCFLQIDKTKSQITQIKDEVDVNSKKVHKLQLKQKQNFYSNEKILMGKSRTSLAPQNKDPFIYNKAKTSLSQMGNLNDTVQSYRNYYEDKIVEIFQEMDRIRNQYYQVLEKLNSQEDSGNDMAKLKNIAEKISKISNPSEEKLKKQLNFIKKDHKKLREEFNQLMGELNNGNGETRTLVIKANENKQDWKQVTQKIFKLRQQLLSYVKDLENKISMNNDLTIVIQQIETSLNECKILNGKKVNITDFQKFSKRIQGRLNNFIRQVCEKEGMAYEQEALIAKQPWFCLSCDSQIKNYTGKIGKPVYTQKISGKKVNPESHMIRRTQSKFPSVH